MNSPLRKSNLVIALLFILFATGCDKDSDDLPSEYVKFELNNHEKLYPGADSVANYCYSTGQCECAKYFSKNFIADHEFYSFTISVRKVDADTNCPPNPHDRPQMFHFTISKKLEDGNFIDYDLSNKSLPTVFFQNLSTTQVEVSGKFGGKFYQWYEVRFDPLNPIREPDLLDSVFIEKGEFRFIID